MTEPTLEAQQTEFLRRTANILAETPWGAEYYRAQISVIAEVERLRRENAILSRFVPHGFHPSRGDPLESLVRLVQLVQAAPVSRSAPRSQGTR